MFLKLCTCVLTAVLLTGITPLEAFSISLGFGVQPVVRPVVVTPMVPVVQPVVPVVQPRPIYYQPAYQSVVYTQNEGVWHAPVYTSVYTPVYTGHAPVYTSYKHKRHRSHCSFGMCFGVD